jgi:hypothetical protein
MSMLLSKLEDSSAAMYHGFYSLVLEPVYELKKPL